MSASMWFTSWSDVGRVLATAAVAYLMLVTVLRTSGKRTLAKLNAFDLVVTVALGSVLATITLSNDVAIAEGAAAIVALVAGQWAVSAASLRSSRAQRFLRASATLVFRDGRFDDGQLSKVRLTRDEVCQAIRSSDRGDLESIAAVVLETDGSLSVIPADHCATASAMPTPSGTLDTPAGTPGPGARRSGEEPT